MRTTFGFGLPAALRSSFVGEIAVSLPYLSYFP